MKIHEILLNEARKKAAKHDDWDDEDDKPEDPDADKVPHIIMQLRKAYDVEGNYPILFKDGKRHKLKMETIIDFMKKYLNAKPLEKEMMQNKAIENIEGLLSVIKSPAASKPDMKIKGNRYMTSFAGDYDDK